MTPPDGGREAGAGEAHRPVEDAAAQLEWEARAGRPAAAAAFAAALLPLIGTIVFVASLGGPAAGDAGLLTAVDAAPVGVVVSAVLRALGLLLLAVALAYLYRATLARRTEAPRPALPLLIVGAVGVAIAIVVYDVVRVDLAATFVGGGDEAEEAADAVIDESVAQTVSLVQLGFGIPFGIATILIALNAMRAGLLGRFMGFIGIGVGIFYIVPLVPPTLILLFWGVALGFLFLGRWPGGKRGPAWDRVEAIPWPTAADRMEAQRQARVEEAQTAAGDGPEPSESSSAPRPASRKRRRGR
jgi:hypothetical protein